MGYFEYTSPDTNVTLDKNLVDAVSGEIGGHRISGLLDSLLVEWLNKTKKSKGDFKEFNRRDDDAVR